MAIIGGGGNLWSNWGKVKNFKQGAAYFASGAVGGAVGVVNPAVGGSITAGGNLATDLATGNMPNFRSAENPAWEIAKYTGGLALDAFGAAGAGSLSKFGYSKLSPFFSSQAIATTAGTSVTKIASWQGGFANVVDEITVKPALRLSGQSALAQTARQGLNLADDVGQKLLPQFSQSTIDDVINSSLRAKGGTNELLRAFDKKLGHAASGGYESAFKTVQKSNESLSEFIRTTLSNPKSTFIGDKVIDAYNPLGQGVRFEQGTNKFKGFLEGILQKR